MAFDPDSGTIFTGFRRNASRQIEIFGSVIAAVLSGKHCVVRYRLDRMLGENPVNHTLQLSPNQYVRSGSGVQSSDG